MYSWRRDTLSDMQARPGTEQARNLAGHKHNSEAIGAYTHRITTDFDVTAFRIQDSGYDPQQLRDIWRQSHSAIYQPSTTGPDLRSVLQERVEAQVVLRKDWEELNQAVKVVTRLLGLIALLTDSRTCFQKLRRSLPHGERSYGNRTIPDYQALLVSRGEQGLSAKLDELLLHRKTHRKIIRDEVRKSKLEKIKSEQEAALKTSMRAAKGNTRRGNPPQAMRDAKDSDANQNPINVTSDIISAAETGAAKLQKEDRDDGDPELLEDIAN